MSSRGKASVRAPHPSRKHADCRRVKEVMDLIFLWLLKKNCVGRYLQDSNTSSLARSKANLEAFGYRFRYALAMPTSTIAS